jgi:hypothetical protein
MAAWGEPKRGAPTAEQTWLTGTNGAVPEPIDSEHGTVVVVGSDVSVGATVEVLAEPEDPEADDECSARL